MLEEKFAEFCRVERARKMLSQQQLADGAGVSLRSVATIEAGKKTRDSTLEAVADFLGYDIEIVRDVKFIKKEK